MRRRITYISLDEDPSVQHPIDQAVHARVDRASRARNLVRTAQAVVDALGKRRRLWFDYERAQGRVTSRREAAYFDVGVEYGVAAARSTGLRGRRKLVEQLAATVVRKVLATGAGRADAAAAAVMAAWALMGGSPVKPARRRSS